VYAFCLYCQWTSLNHKYTRGNQRTLDSCNYNVPTLWYSSIVICSLVGTHLGDEPSTTVYVGNMSYDTDERTLKETFPGTIEVKIINDRETGRPRGYVYMWCVHVLWCCVVLHFWSLMMR